MNRARLGALTVVTAALLAFPSDGRALAETKTEGDSLKLDDSSKVDEPSKVLLWTGVAAGLSFVFLDEKIQDHSQRNAMGIEERGHDVLDTFTAMLPIFAVKGYVLGDDPKARLTARSLMRGIAANTMTTAAIKEVVGRARPNRFEGAYQFDPFSDDLAMPSGHASHSFTIATVLSEVYGEQHRWVAPVAYGAAGFVAYSRIDGNKHWASDVIVGAALGHLIGRWAVRTEGKRMSITPVAFKHGGSGFQAEFRF